DLPSDWLCPDGCVAREATALASKAKPLVAKRAADDPTNRRRVIRTISCFESTCAAPRMLPCVANLWLRRPLGRRAIVKPTLMPCQCLVAMFDNNVRWRGANRGSH